MQIGHVDSSQSFLEDSSPPSLEELPCESPLPLLGYGLQSAPRDFGDSKDRPLGSFGIVFRGLLSSDTLLDCLLARSLARSLRSIRPYSNKRKCVSLSSLPSRPRSLPLPLSIRDSTTALPSPTALSTMRRTSGPSSSPQRASPALLVSPVLDCIL